MAKILKSRIGANCESGNNLLEIDQKILELESFTNQLEEKLNQ